MIKKILAIGAHPDDIEFGCSGFLQKATSSHLLLATKGEKGGDPEKRRDEAINSAGYLNSSLTFLNLLDNEINLSIAIQGLEKEINLFEPDLILTMSKNDTHQDHRVIYEATRSATRNNPISILSYLTPSSTNDLIPNYFIPLSEEEMNKKLEAISFHTSQLSRPYLQKEFILNIARYWANKTKSNYKYVEPYSVLEYWLK